MFIEQFLATTITISVPATTIMFLAMVGRLAATATEIQVLMPLQVLLLSWKALGPSRRSYVHQRPVLLRTELGLAGSNQQAATSDIKKTGNRHDLGRKNVYKLYMHQCQYIGDGLDGSPNELGSQ